MLVLLVHPNSETKRNASSTDARPLTPCTLLDLGELGYLANLASHSEWKLTGSTIVQANPFFFFLRKPAALTREAFRASPRHSFARWHEKDACSAPAISFDPSHSPAGKAVADHAGCLHLAQPSAFAWPPSPRPQPGYHLPCTTTPHTDADVPDRKAAACRCHCGDTRYRLGHLAIQPHQHVNLNDRVRSNAVCRDTEPQGCC